MAGPSSRHPSEARALAIPNAFAEASVIARNRAAPPPHCFKPGPLRTQQSNTQKIQIIQYMSMKLVGLRWWFQSTSTNWIISPRRDFNTKKSQRHHLKSNSTNRITRPSKGIKCGSRVSVGKVAMYIVVSLDISPALQNPSFDIFSTWWQYTSVSAFSMFQYDIHLNMCIYTRVNKEMCRLCSWLFHLLDSLSQSIFPIRYIISSSFKVSHWLSWPKWNAT